MPSRRKSGLASRGFIVIILALSVALPISTQNTGTPPVPAKKDEIYSMALFSSLAEMEKNWGYLHFSGSGMYVPTDYHEMCVKKNPQVTEGLPTHEGNFHVEYLDSRELIERYKKLRKGFAVIEIQPMYSDGSKLKIQISVSYFEYKKGKLMFGVSDWSDVEFRLDSDTQKYVISSIKLGGI